ncbi:MAG: hypothetical protein N3E47_01685 [Candidatus Bathyarchaeota archaeon]|nr:hypothetical protein [Candidatus Bathyarchaeota archaeon]
MSQLNEELIKVVNISMPFPAEVIRAYSRLGMVFTSGDLAKEANIPKSTAKFYVRKMLEMHMISKVPYKKKYQKYANAKNFSDWLMDLIRLAIRPLEEKSRNA